MIDRKEVVSCLDKAACIISDCNYDTCNQCPQLKACNILADRLMFFVASKQGGGGQ